MEKNEQNSASQTVLTVVDAALFLRISESVVRRLIREKRIPYFRIDGRYLFYRPLVEKWMIEISITPGCVESSIPIIDKEGKIWG